MAARAAVVGVVMCLALAGCDTPTAEESTPALTSPVPTSSVPTPLASATGSADAAPPTPAQTETEPSGVRRRLGVRYGTEPGQVLDLLVPPGDGPHPLFVWVHGGGWVTGSRTDNPFADLVDAGVAVASIDHRSALTPYPGTFEDVGLAVASLLGDTESEVLDPARVVLAGFSSGAHLVTLAALRDEVDVSGALSFAGPLDLRELASIPGDAGFGAAALVGVLLDCPVAECPERLAEVSPVTALSADDPPLLVQHGTADAVVASAVAEQVAAVATEVGAPVVLDLVDGLGHAVARTPAVVDFLAERLGIDPAVIPAGR